MFQVVYFSLKYNLEEKFIKVSEQKNNEKKKHKERKFIQKHLEESIEFSNKT